MRSDSTQRSPRPGPFRIGDWLAEPDLCRLSRGETVLKLRPQLMDLLVCLAARAGQVVPRQDILATVWANAYVAESGLARCIRELRAALNDEARVPTFIETIPKRGYRLIAPVAWLPVDVRDSIGPATTGLVRPERTPADSKPVRTVDGTAGLAASATGGPDASTAVGDDAPAQEPAPSAPTPERRRRRRRLVAAAALVLVAAAVAFALVARHVARLPDPPVVTSRDTVVLTFDNTTGDAVFDGTLRLALTVQLEQSPRLRVLSEEHLRQTLRLMGRPPETPISRALAGELCEREHAPVVMAGSLTALGRHYVLGLEAVACRTGEPLGRQQLEVTGKEQILGGLGRMASAIRVSLGESLASLRRYDVPIERATTSSLDALRAFSLAERERLGSYSGTQRAVALYRRAILHDREFALAHARLAATLRQQLATAEAASAYRTAFALRQRVSESERFDIEAQYYTYVTGERHRAREAYQRWKAIYPQSWIPWFGLGSDALQDARYLEAASACRTSLDLAPQPPAPGVCAASALMAQNQHDQAWEVLQRVLAGGGDTPRVRQTLFITAYARADRAAMAAQVAWASGAPEHERLLARLQAWAAMCQGRRREARALLNRATELARAVSPEIVGEVYADLAFIEAIAGDREGVRAAARGVLQHARTPEVRGLAVLPLARVGLVGDARDLARTVGRSPDALFDLVAMGTARATIALAEGQPRQTLAALEPLRRHELGLYAQLVPLWIRAEAHLAAGDIAPSIEAFERLLSNRGIAPMSPHVTLAYLGLGRAYARAGNLTASRRAYEAFLAAWRSADPDLPMLLDARREFASLAAGATR